VKVAVLCRTLGKHCGISEYALCLGEWLNAVVVSSAADVPPDIDITFIQYEPTLYDGLVSTLIDEIRHLPSIVVVDIHTELPSDIVQTLVLVAEEWPKALIPAVKLNPRHGMWYLPHVNYPEPDLPDVKPTKLKLGSFGLAYPNKRYEEIFRLAWRLKVPTIVLAAEGNATSEIAMLSAEYIHFLQEIRPPNVELDTNFYTRTEIISVLRSCSHLICAMEDLGRISGSLRLMALAHRPIISLPCTGASEVGAITVPSLRTITKKWLIAQTQLSTVEDGIYQYHRLLKELFK